MKPGVYIPRATSPDAPQIGVLVGREHAVRAVARHGGMLLVGSAHVTAV
jgi:hypothetical protein